MGLESKLPVMSSSLNPNASEFVPAARRVVAAEAPVPVAPPAPFEEFSEEWWSRFESDEAFKAQVMSGFAGLSAEQRHALAEDLDELADFDQFEVYQEHLVDMEEDEILARNLREMDCYLDEDLSLTGANGVANGVAKEFESRKDLQRQQQPAPWSKNPTYYPNKTMPHKSSSALGMAIHKRLKLNVSFPSDYRNGICWLTFFNLFNSDSTEMRVLVNVSFRIREDCRGELCFVHTMIYYSIGSKLRPGIPAEVQTLLKVRDLLQSLHC